ncbi:MAG: VPS10 domain-containing protein [bacterium]
MFCFKKLTIVIACFVVFSSTVLAKKEDQQKSKWNAKTFSGISLRNIGPALMSGRIADISVDPDDENLWYVGVGSGGVWKTTNAGVTWTPIFDKQNSFSIGDVTLDPSNSNTVWVGTGENVGGRHVAYGDGIYVSHDGGENWENKGLKNSEHISTIVVHPTNSKIVWVAAQGPLWSKGGDRGLYKTSDGGEHWKKVLGDDEWIGVTDVVIDPRNPDVLYAATWQRYRTVANYMGGGPGSAIYRSDDGGENWIKLKKGLPEGNVGKIGLAISPQKPDVVYAAIELDQRKGGIYRSENRGASWTKKSDAISGGTGPHYYQELYASPHAFDRIYLANNLLLISDDGGKTTREINVENMHVDFHAMVFRKDDPDYLMVGVDGGLYETFDLAKTWRFVSNLPITQFYKVAVDDDKPFYNVYGGAQDNNTQGGPSRTDNIHGIRNSDWFVTLFGDGAQPATEPGNPDVVYSQWQQGNLTRFDRPSGEMVYIKPQGAPQDPPERFNWDAPILVSSHDPKRLYHASQRVWRSDDRGDSWSAISADLTKNENRLLQPMMDRQWSWDSPWDLYAMSTYNTITSLAESPIDEKTLYAGTDDGLIQVTRDGGKSWHQISVNKLPGVPKTAFVNDIKADLYDADTVYVALDNHKFGDFKPYLFMSSNAGKSWKSISGDLPERDLVWRLVQDHVKKDLLFLGTETGVYFSVNAGDQWIELIGNVPNISFRDLAIQKRENDLVGATFGRGIFILDDYTPLRSLNRDSLEKNAILFKPRTAWWYIPKRVLDSEVKGSQGDAFFTAPNPDFGATFTYYLKDEIKTLKQKRTAREKELIKNNKNTPAISFKQLIKEDREPDPQVILTITDSEGVVIRRIKAKNKSGFHRVSWDLRYPDPTALGDVPSEDDGSEGFMVGPGVYTATLSSVVSGKVTPLSKPVSVHVVPLRQTGLKGAKPEVVAAFWKRLSKLQKKVSAAEAMLAESHIQIERMKKALSLSNSAPSEIDQQLYQLEQKYFAIKNALDGDKNKEITNTPQSETISSRYFAALLGTVYSTYGPTKTHLQSIGWAEDEFEEIRKQLNAMALNEIPSLQKKMIEAGAPWQPGVELP